jgi:3',5'-cyclic AMP phosphodiesterase CpdA
VIIAQISDTHVHEPGGPLARRVDATGLLARAVEHLARLDPRPDVTLVTGDLVETGSPAEYARVRRLLDDLPMPLYVVPGNHDDRGCLRAAFRDRAYLPRAGFIQYAIDTHPVRLIALDTVVPGRPWGHLCDERLAWLTARLAEAPDRPTVIFMHHAPFPTGIRILDAMGLEGAGALGAIVERHPQVERVLCGHLHRPIQVRWRGTVASSAPSTGLQVALDLRADGDLAMGLEPAACQLHVWREEVGLVSHTSYIGEYAGPWRIYGDT